MLKMRFYSDTALLYTSMLLFYTIQYVTLLNILQQKKLVKQTIFPLIYIKCLSMKIELDLQLLIS